MKPLYVSLLMLSLAETVYSLPRGHEAIGGTKADVQLTPGKMLVSTGDKAIIHWNSFNIGENEHVQFLQPSSSSSVLNRDFSGSPSQILGSLTSNGNVYLINQSGLIFGENAYINAASFIASTLDILNDKFLEGSPLVFSGDMGGEIVHLGKISAQMGDVMLIGRKIRNEGVIEAHHGTIGMASGVEILVQPQASEKIFIRAMHEKAQQDGTGLDIQGALSALQVELKADGNLYQMAIKNGAHIEAMSSIEKDGKIFLVAESGMVETGGNLVAKGGEVRVLGEHVWIASDAKIDVSSDLGGGTVLIGGDFQGKNGNILNAAYTVVAPGSSIKADALAYGNGGKVIVWADNTTGFYGNIRAEGGQLGGDGGQVEVSGKYNLDFHGPVSTLAPQGKAGNLLLDPVNVLVSAVVTAFEMVVPGPAGTWFPQVGACGPLVNINNGDLATSWMAGDVFVVTSPDPMGCGQPGFISVLAPVAIAAPGTSNSLTFIADENIYVVANITNSNTVTGTGDISLRSLTGNIFIGTDELGAAAPGAVVVGTANGLTLLQASSGSIQVGFAANTGTFPCQVGYGLAYPVAGTPITGQITLQAGVDIDLLGGMADRAFAQVGHGEVAAAFGMQTTMEGVSTPGVGMSSITLVAGGDITLSAGGGARECYAQIGHGGIDVNNDTNPIDAPISIDADGIVTLIGGQGGAADLLCYAQIGHMGGADINVAPRVFNNENTSGLINMGANGALGVQAVFLQGGTSPRSWARIGHGGDNRDVFGSITGNVFIRTTSVAGINGITLVGGLGSNAFTQIGHGGGGSLARNIQFGDSVSGITLLNIQAGDLLLFGAFDTAAVPGGSGSFAQVGHGGVFATSNLGGGLALGNSTWSGNIIISLDTTPTLGNVTVVGGNCSSAYAQIGHGGAASLPNAIGSSTISVTCSNVFVGGPINIGPTDAGLFSYGVIGHGGLFVSPAGAVPDAQLGAVSGTIAGDILITASNEITLIGDHHTSATITSAPGVIGHAPFIFLQRPVGSTMNPTWSVSGDINLLCTGQGTSPMIDIAAGRSDAGAWIGHGPLLATTFPLTISGDISVAGQGTTSLSITGSSFAANTGNPNAAIGHGGGYSTALITALTTYTGSDTITAATIGVSGGTSAGLSLITTPSATGTQTITASGPGLFGFAPVLVTGGFAAGAHAGITTNGTDQTITTPSFMALGGTAGASFAYVANNNASGDTTIQATQGDIVFLNGLSATNNPALLQSTVFPVVCSGAGVTLNATGDVVLSNDLSTSGSKNINLVAGNTIPITTGAFKVDTGTHNILGMPLLPGANGITLTTSSGRIFIHGTSTFHGYSQVDADFQIGDPTDLSLLASNDLLPATLLSTSGRIVVDPYRNIYINSGTTGGVSTTGNVFLIADNDIRMSGTGQVIGNNVFLVVDNQDPASPAIGPGAFAKEATNTITGTTVRIFTSRRSQNSIAGSINGTAFAPGTLFLNTATEQWGVYFPSLLGGSPFTIFYKEFGIVPVPAVVAAQVAVSQLFYYFDQWNNYLYWDLRFNIGYDREPYLAAADTLDKFQKQFYKFILPYEKSGFFQALLPGIKEQKAMSSYDLIEDREVTLPPQWKADGKQYNNVIY